MHPFLVGLAIAVLIFIFAGIIAGASDSFDRYCTEYMQRKLIVMGYHPKPLRWTETYPEGTWFREWVKKIDDDTEIVAIVSGGIIRFKAEVIIAGNTIETFAENIRGLKKVERILKL